MLKDLAKIAGVAAAAFLIYWIGAWMYWHFTLVGALNSMERDIRTAPIPEHNRAYFFTDRASFEEIRGAGCRALPYLADNLSDKRSLAFLTAASDLILEGMGYKPDEFSQLGVALDDTPESRDEKIRELQLLWRVEGRRFHQWWRVWTGECPVLPKPGAAAP